MNADERYDIMVDEIFDLKQEVKELQGKLSKLEKRIAAEGFSDLETMISKYKTVMLAANELSIETDEEIESLKARLAEAERRERAAVMDLKAMALVMRESEELSEGCCFACICDGQNLPDGCILPYGECPGFERDDCFEWRGERRKL